MQVAPAELEALLLTHPAVLDVAVVRKADEEAGEVRNRAVRALRAAPSCARGPRTSPPSRPGSAPSA